MSVRPILKPHAVVEAGDMSADVISDVTVIQWFPFISYSIVWTGSPVGTFSVEVSNDYSEDPAGNVRNPGTWSPLELSGPITAAGSADSAVIDIDGAGAYAIRLKYAATSGSGSLDVVISGKVS